MPVAPSPCDTNCTQPALALGTAAEDLRNLPDCCRLLTPVSCHRDYEFRASSGFLFVAIGAAKRGLGIRLGHES